METEQIRIGRFIERDGKYLGLDYESNRIWTTDLSQATLYSDDMTVRDMFTVLDLLLESSKNAKLVPVKKVTQFQL